MELKDSGPGLEGWFVVPKRSGTSLRSAGQRRLRKPFHLASKSRQFMPRSAGGIGMWNWSCANPKVRWRFSACLFGETLQDPRGEYPIPRWGFL